MPRALLVIATLLLLAACTSSPSGGDEPRTIQVRMADDLRFEPSHIEVRVGETIRFELINAGQAVHEFLIGDEDEQAEYAREMADAGHGAHGDESVEPGERSLIEYTFTEPGALLAGCHQPGHYEGGMVATISVRD